MTLEALVTLAKEQAASDLHLEGGLPAALRIRGELKTFGEPVSPATLTDFARGLLGPDAWGHFVDRQSADLSRRIQGVRCRVNVLRTSRGVGFAIRLLSSFQATLTKLNLHPELRRLVVPQHGLILVSGPTGSGKSTTLSALLQEVNLSEARHIVTIESPIEYALTPRLSFIRQREVGRDTPSFDQALLDALREDPDVLMVGELRDPQTMRLTLNAAETGHLVLATVHSSSAAEALGRVVSAFPSDIQPSVCAQLADCLVGVVCQRLQYRASLGIRVPECEVLMGSTPVKSLVRQGAFFKLQSAVESGAADGSWSFARYGAWLDQRSDWFFAAQAEASAEEVSPSVAAPPTRPPPARRARPMPEDEVIEIDPDEDDPEEILRELQRRPPRG